MFTPSEYNLHLPAAQLQQLTGGDAALLAAAEAEALSEIKAYLNARYDLAPLDAGQWPSLLRTAAIDLIVARLGARSLPQGAPTHRVHRATAAREWLESCQAGNAWPGLLPRQELNARTGLPEASPLIGGSHPRAAQDRPE
jgi:phage gp36-like protein